MNDAVGQFKTILHKDRGHHFIRVYPKLTQDAGKPTVVNDENSADIDEVASRFAEQVVDHAVHLCSQDLSKLAIFDLSELLHSGITVLVHGAEGWRHLQASESPKNELEERASEQFEFVKVSWLQAFRALGSALRSADTRLSKVEKDGCGCLLEEILDSPLLQTKRAELQELLVVVQQSHTRLLHPGQLAIEQDIKRKHVEHARLQDQLSRWRRNPPQHRFSSTREASDAAKREAELGVRLSALEDRLHSAMTWTT